MKWSDAEFELESISVRHTASSCAFLPGQGGVSLRRVGSSQLTESNREKSSEEEQTGSRHD
jgi:hypothetical protein